MSDVQAVLSCEALAKRYADAATAVQVLEDVNLSVQPAERVAIVGASGSGKSTLLHLLGGLDRPTTGEVTIAGQRMTGLSEAARGRLRNRLMGFVYQFHHLLAEFSAEENVAMPLLLRGDKPKMAAAAARKMLGRVGLEQRLNHRPGELSGGERQRAAVARALVTGPACILADEPTGNLDRQNAEQVYDLMLELNADLNTALIVVTHDHNLAARADTRYEICDGKLQRI